MGAKQSSDVSGSRRVRFSSEHGDQHRSSSNRHVVPTRRSTVTMGALGAHRHRPVFPFENNNVVDIDSSNPLGRQTSPSNSSVNSGLRIPPRQGLEWLYANHMHERSNGTSPEDDSIPSRVSAEPHGHRSVSRSLPPFLFNPNRDSKCSMCGKLIPAEDKEFHFVLCLTKPRVTYNEEVLSTTSGECAICLEDLEEGEAVARLPCLCIYHKVCIDQWFVKSQTCPEHPPD